MENQHRKISGYRELSQQEIDLMNKIKAKGNELGELVAELEELPALSFLDQQKHRSQCIRDARTDLRHGVMMAVRAVALPQDKL